MIQKLDILQVARLVRFATSPFCTEIPKHSTNIFRGVTIPIQKIQMDTTFFNVVYYQ